MISSTSRDSLHTLRIASCAFSSSSSILLLFSRLSALGIPVSDQSGCGIDLGTVRFAESG